MENLRAPYQHQALPYQTSFRIFELLPGGDSDPIAGILHIVNWDDIPSYESISYAWGDAKQRASIIVDEKSLDVTVNLHTALLHLRDSDSSRLLWADAICINQSDIPERGSQVAQMRKIYQKAKTVLIWVGPDSSEPQAKVAVDSIIKISDFLCQKLGIAVSDLNSVDNVYQDIMAKAHSVLPVPDECEFSSEATWKSLVWFYSHPYFTRTWAIQEVNANTERVLHCGLEKVIWDRVSLVACYITMETTFSQKFGFTKAYCWWAATVTTDLVQPRNWLLMLYLASNFTAIDPRDVIYGLRGMMKIHNGAELLKPDYTKSVTEVYRDAVEAALMDYDNTNVLFYVHGTEVPSWIPRWDVPMLFRNPFRFGKSLPWKPAGESRPVWSIDKRTNVLSLTGSIISSIKFVAPYNENIFGDGMRKSVGGRESRNKTWERILAIIQESQNHIPLSAADLTAAATSFSFGLNEKSDPENESVLLQRFVAYLREVLAEDTFQKYVPEEVSEEASLVDGRLFGKPVWDFEYPESTFFITEDKRMGCVISTAITGDVVHIAPGSTFPLVLHPDGEEFRIRGFAFVHGLMHGELTGIEEQVISIR